MTDTEYRESIFKISTSGRSHQAIDDLIKYLQIEHDDMELCLREYHAERTAIRKICKGKTFDKNKVSAVLSMCEDMRGEEV